MRILKSLFVMAAFCISTAFASDYEVYVAENQMGGRIVLTFIDCPLEELKGSKISVSRNEEKQIYGCWFLHNGTIYVAWFHEGNVHKKEYSPKIFTKELLL